MSDSRYVFVLAMCLVAPSALADSIFTCTDKDGKVVLRDFPCPAESASKEMTGPATTEPRRTGPGGSSQDLRPGMSKGEVRAILGNPTQVTQEEGVEGRVDTWSYGSQTLQFDATGHLIK
jgi:hypothetical protein